MSYLVLDRRRVRSARLVINGVGLSLYQGSRMRWQIGWPELDLVILRKYTLRYSYFHEALVFRTKKGNARIVPAASMLYGKMPELDALSARIREFGYSVKGDYRQLWLAPGWAKRLPF